MRTFQDRIEAIDAQAEQLASGFRNLEPEAIIAFRDLMAYEFHMENRGMAILRAEEMVLSRTRAEVYRMLGVMMDEVLAAKREPEEGINGPEETDD